MVKPRASRKKPIVLSSDSEHDTPHSPPPKRPKRGTLTRTSNGARGNAQPSIEQTRRAASPRGATPLPASKSPSKSPAKPKPIYKPITSFFSTAPRSQTAQPTPSPEKPAASTQLDELDEIIDSSDDDNERKPPIALPVRKSGKAALDSSDAAPKPSQRFFRKTSGPRNTPPPSQSVTVEHVDRRPWNEKFGPATLDELAVHKRKVADVRAWLSGVFGGRERKRLLLLKGPAGSGKTTTMSLLSKDLGFDVHEWKNPTNSVTSPDGFISVTAQFEDFIGRTGAFGSLAFDEPAPARPQQPPSSQSSRQKQLILVEEFPNTFGRTSSAVQSFRSAVLNYLAASTPSATAFFSGKPDSEKAVTPMVMIISETLLSTNTAAADSFTAHRLLGPEILTHPGVTVIEFNPIAPTFMTKALDLVVVKEARKTGRKKTVGPQVIQRLSELGDVRSAVSSLEFLCVRGDDADGWGANVSFTKKKAPKDTPMTKMENESLEMVTQRESTLGIFHAVGRVVYNKRHPEDPSNPVPQPPNWFPQRRRPKPSEVDVDALIDELGTDTHTFIAALHENYVLSCQSQDSEETADSIDGCIEALSDADLLSPDRFGTSGSFGRRNFQGTPADNLRQDEMCFQTSVRGLLYNLPYPVKRAAPPPGVMGLKPKGSGAGPNKGSAHAMYYPTSARLWKQQEEIGGLLELWISRAQRGELFSTNGASKPVTSASGGVDTWRKNAQSTPTTNHSASINDGTTEASPPILLGSGGSARYEMLLERLPYLPIILRKAAMPSPSIAATIRDVQKITQFTGTAIGASAEDDEGDGIDEAGETEQSHWTTDTPETPRKKKKIRIASRKHEEQVESALAGIKDMGGLVLSDDDIEDIDD